MPYPRRLIEVDLPIKRISAHARREKSIRHGHISTLHIWWARRPLAACRAVICAALWPDPADPHCPDSFPQRAADELHGFARKAATSERLRRGLNDWWYALSKETGLPSATESQRLALRKLLLDFIADFANWDNAAQPEFLETARALTAAAHEALGGEPGTRPLVVDPFAGGGSIPLEALRVGADAFASDLNPIPVLLNKVVLEYIPRYGQKLADAVREWGAWIKAEAEKELSQFYPKDPDGATPIAYLWARTITCEGPGCGAEVPLMRSLWLSKKDRRSVALRLVPDREACRVDFEIIRDVKASEVGNGTVQRGSATCPVCGFTTPVASVRRQLKARRGGAADARLFCVVTTRPGEQGRHYRLPTERDLKAVQAATEELERRKAAHNGPLSLVPDEPLPPQGTLGFRVQLYGMEEWGDLFTPRQLLSLTTLATKVREAGARFAAGSTEQFAEAVKTVLGLSISRYCDISNSLCVWENTKTQVRHLFTRQAIPILWDFAEPHIFADAAGDYAVTLGTMIEAIESQAATSYTGTTNQNSATRLTLPDDVAQGLVTDPPYYDAVPYSDLSDFFYVWLKRTLPNLPNSQLTPKTDEITVDEVKGKDRAYFEHMMGLAMAEGRRILAPDGIGAVVFAHKSTAGWEAMLQAMIEAGWTITGSWPIDTELGNRLRAQDSAALASSIHLACRPREDATGAMSESVGDWRDVLSELPRRIHEWMPRLSAEGVVGADAIFACLGPALEIFSRYARVEKASGDPVSLREYLEQVWAAVSREALAMIFQGADASGLEEDARLTAMWLWTLSTGGATESEDGEAGDEDDSGEDEEKSGKPALSGGYVLEYDAARKIAQGLGAHLERLAHLVEVRGDKARLLPVSERAEYLFGKDAGRMPTVRRKRGPQQLSLFAAMSDSEGESEAEGWDGAMVAAGKTLLDRVHQSMILFALGRGEALRRFLVEDGIGQEGRFWRLAQSLSALYPSGADEKRWIDGVLARKKGLGL